MPGSMMDRDPVVAQRKERYFTIPGNSNDEWDAGLHGLERTHDVMDDEVAEIGWTPGRYTYVAGASGNEFVFQVPEAYQQRWPSMDVLKGIHLFLGVVLDES